MPKTETKIAQPSEAEVLNVYLYIKALTMALTMNERAGYYQKRKPGGRITKTVFESELGVPYSEAFEIFQQAEFACLVKSDAHGFEVELPAEALAAIETRKGLTKEITMLSVLPVWSDYAFELRRALKIHSEWFPSLYSSKMLDSLEMRKAA